MMMALFDEEQVMRAYVESEKREAAAEEEDDAQARVQKYWK